jgi:hypothetical protein
MAERGHSASPSQQPQTSQAHQSSILSGIHVQTQVSAPGRHSSIFVHSWVQQRLMSWALPPSNADAPALVATPLAGFSGGISCRSGVRAKLVCVLRFALKYFSAWLLPAARAGVSRVRVSNYLTRRRTIFSSVSTPYWAAPAPPPAPHAHQHPGLIAANACPQPAPEGAHLAAAAAAVQLPLVGPAAAVSPGC